MDKSVIKKVLKEVENIRKEEFDNLRDGRPPGITYSLNLNRNYSNADIIIGIYYKNSECLDKLTQRLESLHASIEIKTNFGKIKSLQI